MIDQGFRTYCERTLAPFLDDLAVLSRIDCGTPNIAGVNMAARIMQAKLEKARATVEVHTYASTGDMLVARWHGTGRLRIMLIGHLDTVYPEYWTDEHPFSIEGDRALGPGTCDMKAGLLSGLYAVSGLLKDGFQNFAEITFVMNSDEEAHSPVSTALIEREARGCDAVLVLEAARENGAIVSARKGLAHFELIVQGRAAHAGVEPEHGRSAILELAHQVVALQKLNQQFPGVNVNVGVISGGTVSNVIAAEACAAIDVRATSQVSMEAVVEALHRRVASPYDSGTSMRLSGGIIRQPMEKIPGTARLVACYQQLAHELGLTIADSKTGGVSDGNTTSALGIATLDGLGPVGGRDHSPDEYVLIPSIIPRMLLLGELICAICRSESL